MGSLRDQRKKQKGAAPQNPPKPKETLVEPPAASVPKAPAVPVAEAPEERSPPTTRSTPAPEEKPAAEEEEPAPAIAQFPEVPETKVEMPAAAPVPAEASVPEETAPPESASDVSSGELSVGSGDIVVDDEPEAPVSSKPKSVLGDILASVGEPEAAEEQAEAPEKAAPPPMPAEEPKKAKGTAAFDSEGESFLLKKSGYRLVYEGMASATSCKFTLLGKEMLRLELNLSVPETVDVESADGPVQITLFYKGTNERGKKEVDFEVEGGVGQVAKKAAQVRKAGSAAGSWLASLRYHVPEIISGAMITGVTIGLAVLETVKSQLGSLHVAAAVAYGVVGAAITGWAAWERRKDIRKLEESNVNGE